MLIVAFMGYACFLGSCEEGGSAAWVPPSSLRVCMDFLFSRGERERKLFLKNDWQRRDIKHPVKIWLSCWLHMDTKVKSTDDIQNTAFHFILKKNDITMHLSFSLSFSLSLCFDNCLSHFLSGKKTTLSLSIHLSVSLSGRTTCLLMSEKKRATQGLCLFFPFLLLISNVTSSLWSVVTVDPGNRQTDARDIPEKN